MKKFIIWLSATVVVSLVLFFTIVTPSSRADERELMVYMTIAASVILSVLVGLIVGVDYYKESAKDTHRIFSSVFFSLCLSVFMGAIFLLLGAGWFACFYGLLGTQLMLVVLFPATFGFLFLLLSSSMGILDPELESKLE